MSSMMDDRLVVTPFGRVEKICGLTPRNARVTVGYGLKCIFTCSKHTALQDGTKTRKRIATGCGNILQQKLLTRFSALYLYKYNAK